MDFSKGEVSDTIVYHWLDQEVRNCRASNVPMASLYIEAMRSANIDNVENEAKRVVKYLLNEGSEDALLGAMRITQMSNSQQSDSISKAILAKYPKGKWALKCQYDLVIKVKDDNQKKGAFLQLLNDFPRNDEFDSMLDAYGHTYDGIYQTIIYIDYINNQNDSMLSYVHKMSFGGVLNVFYRLVDIPHKRKDITDKELYPLAKNIVDYLDVIRKTKPYRYAYLTDSEWENKVERMIGNVVYLPYAEILNSIGETEKSLEYARRAQNLSNYQSSPLNELMAYLFKKTGDDKELQNVLEKSVFANQVSEYQMAMLKELYIKNNKSDKGYEAYVAGLKNPSEKSAIKKVVANYKKTGVMPAWRLVDSNGKTVSSEQLKGKVYVLDFWSTWCVPCKASLPGMKLAVEHYKNDKGVAFYFIDTQEFAPDFKVNSAKYLKENGFDFNLLYDGKMPNKKINEVLCNQVMKKYTISGIPMKVVVDKKGNVRFLAIGYKGSPSELKDEMVEMIEQAKLY
jgi:Thiol-disulfide isomerase and thioredoxins